MRSQYKRYLKIKDYHSEDRPREKLINKGKKALTSSELLGIIIGSGISNLNSVDLARHLLQSHENQLSSIARLSLKELTKFKGIGKAKAATIISSLELANRLLHEYNKCPTINVSKDAYKLIKNKLFNKLTEEFWIILLNKRNFVIKIVQISQGGLVSTTVDEKIIFKKSLLYNAQHIILVHNHPSGDPQPSLADIRLTKNIIKASKTLSMKILDHLIFCDNTFFSFADEGLIDSLAEQKS